MSGKFDQHPFLLAPTDVAAALKTNLENGLASTQVSQLQQECPPNELDIKGAIPWYTIFFKQLFNAMILVCTSPVHVLERAGSQSQHQLVLNKSSNRILFDYRIILLFEPVSKTAHFGLSNSYHVYL